MNGVIAIWLVGGLLTSFALHWETDSEMPWSTDTMGHMLVWPLFVMKWVFLLGWWILSNIGESMTNSFKQLVHSETKEA